MTREQHGSEPAEGEVSETNNLRESDAQKGIQQGEGVPPGADAQQENQSRIEAEISPDDPAADDVDEAIDLAEGRDHA